MKRPQSSFHQFRQRIPADVLSKARGLALALPVAGAVVSLTLSNTAETVQVSLRTRDPREAKARHAALSSHLERVWQGLREGQRTLNHKEATALAGEMYVSWVGVLERNPLDEETWFHVKEANAVAKAGEYGLASLVIGDEARMIANLEARFGWCADWCLARHALHVDERSRVLLLTRVAAVMDKAADRLAANARGDYRQDDNLASFPTWERPPTRPAAAVSTGMKDILDGWWAEAKARNLSLSTYESYSATAAKFMAFLGHDDAARVTADDVIRFKDHRLKSVNPRTGRPISPATVKDNDLAALKTVFGWALMNRKLAANPAQGITVGVSKRIITRSKGLTDAEADALLTAALHYTSTSEQPRMAAAKRWVPWLCAYTGARLGEMVQVRKQDVRQQDGVWVLNITPEAGTVKTKEARTVVLHPHLIELGFLRFVHGSAEGHLFLKPNANGDVRGPWRGVKNRLQAFARETVTDPSVAPNHGWRHRFKTVGRSVGIEAALLDRITGHAPRTVGDSYGDYTTATQFEKISRMPRYLAGLTSPDLRQGTE